MLFQFYKLASSLHVFVEFSLLMFIELIQQAASSRPRLLLENAFPLVCAHTTLLGQVLPLLLDTAINAGSQPSGFRSLKSASNTCLDLACREIFNAYFKCLTYITAGLLNA